MIISIIVLIIDISVLISLTSEDLITLISENCSVKSVVSRDATSTRVEY